MKLLRSLLRLVTAPASLIVMVFRSASTWAKAIRIVIIAVTGLGSFLAYSAVNNIGNVEDLARHVKEFKPWCVFGKSSSGGIGLNCRDSVIESINPERVNPIPVPAPPEGARPKLPDVPAAGGSLPNGEAHHPPKLPVPSVPDVTAHIPTALPNLGGQGSAPQPPAAPQPAAPQPPAPPAPAQPQQGGSSPERITTTTNGGEEMNDGSGRKVPRVQQIPEQYLGAVNEQATKPLPVPAVQLVPVQTAQAQLAALQIGKPGGATYDRKAWRHWSGSPCNTREQLLIQHGAMVASDPRTCKVSAGVWRDPYSGDALFATKKVDIDHIIPLKYASDHGGSGWSPERKEQYANDTRFLIISSRHQNGVVKRDKGPAAYMPPRQDYHCAYAKLWVMAATEYQLSITSADQQALANALQSCPA